MKNFDRNSCLGFLPKNTYNSYRLQLQFFSLTLTLNFSMHDAVECDIVVAGYRNTLCNCVVTTKIFLQNEVAVRETKMLKWNSGKQIETFTQILRQSDRNDARRPCERQRTRINNDAKKASFPTTYRDWRI